MSGPFEPPVVSTNTPSLPHRRGYSLGLLFYTTTIAAIVAAACRYVVGNDAATWTLIFKTCTSLGVCGAIVGAVVGFRYSWSAFGFMAGTFLGGVSGALGGWISLVDVALFQELLLVTLIGCWALILFALLADRFQP